MLPETIGSIAYLSKFGDELKRNVFAGYVLSCLGDKGKFSLVKGPNQNCRSSKFLLNILKNKKFNLYNFLERGSDERQYCSPGINLPVSLFCRSKFHYYKEYHSSLDNLNLINQKNLQQSLDVLIKLINFFEKNNFPENKIMCEAKLSKRGLYPALSKFDSHNPLSERLKLRTNFLAYANGERTTLEISKIIKVDMRKVKKEEQILLKNKLISF